MSEYIAASIEEIAETFEQFAEDQRQFIKRVKTKRERDSCAAKALIWAEAADIVRNTRIEP